MARRDKLPKVLEKDEQQAFLDVFNTRYPTQLRNKTMVLFMLRTGARLSETTNMKWKYINLESGKVQIIEGKGAKDRNVWANEETIEQLKEWKERQEEELSERDCDTEYVFSTLQGNKIDDNNVRNMIYKYADKAGVQEYEYKENNEGKVYKERKVTPHTLRHSHATDLLDKGVDLKTLQRILGHANLETTEIYLHVNDKDVEAAMKSL